MPVIKKNEACQVTIDDRQYPCPISMAMDLIGGKWKGVILYYLKDGNKRFSELCKDIPNITEMTLSLQLKKMEADGLVKRKVEGIKPPLKVDYSLTEFGESLRPVLNAISVWANSVIPNKLQDSE